METFEYPKINTLYKRNESGKIMPGEFSCEEFTNITRWRVTEKIDGTNIRIIYTPAKGDSMPESLIITGRTDNAKLPPKLLEYLKSLFTSERLSRIAKSADGSINSEIILFGEGYGGNIQSGGRYRKDVGFILFDVWIDGWWLNFDSVIEIAKTLEIDHVPDLGVMYMDVIVHKVSSKDMKSEIAEDKTLIAEGVVATAIPMMLFRNKTPIRFKLKARDF